MHKTSLLDLDVHVNRVLDYHLFSVSEADSLISFLFLLDKMTCDNLASLRISEKLFAVVLEVTDKNVTHKQKAISNHLVLT